MQIETLEIYNETHKTQIKDWDFLYEKFKGIKDKILGKNFQLSLSILNPKNAEILNKKRRNKNYIPNTLSFKYSDNSGEIILTPEIIQKETYDSIRTTPPLKGEVGRGPALKNFHDKVLYLFIHSCLHLTDLDHGTKMDTLEKKYIKAFVI